MNSHPFASLAHPWRTLRFTIRSSVETANEESRRAQRQSRLCYTNRSIMKRIFLFQVVLLALEIAALQTVFAQTSTPPDMATTQEKHLRNVRQLTFGGQNAEAYFSADGQKLIFQSTRDNLQCDQIFTMNVDGSNVQMVSN